MFKKTRTPGDYMLFVVFILLISFIVNVYISVSNYKFKYRVGKESYNNVENIRVVNEGNIEILTNSIKIGSLENMELLKLYRNYGELSESMIDLWDEYSFYEESRPTQILKKRIKKNDVVLNDTNGIIEQYLRSLMEKEMKTQTYKVQLSDKVLDNFNSMLNLSKEIDQYYTEFYDKKLNGAIDEQKEKKIIKNYYWIDVLEDLNIMSKKYSDVDFTVK